MKTIITLTAIALALTACQVVPGTEANRIAKAQEAVAATLKDPTSPLFTEVKAAEDGACGLVNGKNSFGAYAGTTRFVAREDTEPMVENALQYDFQKTDFEAAWRACQAGGSMLTASIDSSYQEMLREQAAEKAPARE